ncbi:MAG: PadR family transcriptional regulator [Oscillospiraceae bacterium]|jgi:DNA-binding PadR family transcriptional regulator|nr:PadR family transcriptional regulator [Oscillospiraceae bacterium]MCI9363943.1 PadR family transcriptional regulator [Oscillospiraceae bacterium]MCI9669589.1 PadR family transcriptional regulator [Oscillospiraceae bacterium]
MSSIDLVILGMVLEKSQSAYDIQKDIEYHHFSRWTKISVPSVYRKVLQLEEKGYLQSNTIKGGKAADKTIYSITEKGCTYFDELMNTCVSQQIPLLFDFNVVIANLNKLEKNKALDLIDKLRDSIAASMQVNQVHADDYANIPLVGKTIFDQQRLLYQSLLEWLERFENQFKESGLK